MYHNIVDDHFSKSHDLQSISIRKSDFVKQIKLLKKFFKIITLDQYVNFYQNNKLLKKHIAITFDDGTNSTYKNILEIFTDLDVFGSVFANSIQFNDGQLIWANQIYMLVYDDTRSFINFNSKKIEFKGISHRRKIALQMFDLARKSGDPYSYIKRITKVNSINSKLIDEYKGIQKKDFIQSKHITIEAHTHSHYFLTDLNFNELNYEIEHNIKKIKLLTGREPRFFAYPNGDYSLREIEVLKKYNFKGAFAVKSKNILEKKWEIPRVGIFSNSQFKFILKLLINLLYYEK